MQGGARVAVFRGGHPLEFGWAPCERGSAPVYRCPEHCGACCHARPCPRCSGIHGRSSGGSPHPG
eukprot:4130404-Alexandrium_andersonii.AAC.1